MTVDTGWIHALQAAVSHEVARTASIFTRLKDDRLRVTKAYAAIAERMDHVTARRESTPAPQLHASVVQAFRTRQFAGLTHREQRYAARRFETFEPHEMQSFLAVHPGAWQTFASECFRRWDELQQRAARHAYARLLCLAPSSVRFLQGKIPLTELVGDTGAIVLARSLAAGSLAEARKELEARGWSSKWAFTSIVLAMWAWDKSHFAGVFQAFWAEVREDRALEAMLLPRRAAVAMQEGSALQSWFSEHPRPASIRPCVSAHAVFVATMFRAAKLGGPDADGWGQLSEGILRSEFKDPRIPPESTGWAYVKEFSNEAYEFYLELLISEDLEIFFDHAMQDHRRRTFWLRYLRSLRRTVCILDGSTHDRLRTKLAGADKKMAAALQRARRFVTRGGSAGAQAFCLYFDRHVIVEFSEKGNAAYVYKRADFEAEFEKDVVSQQVRDHNALKRTYLCVDRIIHNSHSWEDATEEALWKLGIVPDKK